MRAVQAAKKSREDNTKALEPPEALIKSINEGNCVAFVGAGFSAAAGLPGWAALLLAILDRGVQKQYIDEETEQEIREMIKKGTSSAFDKAAQVMEDRCGQGLFGEVLSQKLKPPEQDQIPDAMLERLRMLFSIPFAAILTTNFDYFLPGKPADHEDSKPLMRQILRDSPQPLPMQILQEHFLRQRFEEVTDIDLDADIEGLDSGPAGLGVDHDDSEDEEKKDEEVGKADSDSDSDSDSDDDFFAQLEVPIIQVHGTVVEEQYRKKPGLAFTRKGYRRLLHGNVSYSKFMAACMSSKTMLYIGFSFSDEYINELRSSIMMMLQNDVDDDDDEDEAPAADSDDDEGAEAASAVKDKPASREKPQKVELAYAISINLAKSEMEFYEIHEGLTMLNYVSEDGPGFEGMEKWLKAIAEKTNPLLRWFRCLEKSHVAVVGNSNLLNYFAQAHTMAKRKFTLEGTLSFLPMPEEDLSDAEVVAFMEEANSKQPVDLIIADYGHGSKGPHPALSFLKVLGNRYDLRAPIVVTDGSKEKYHNDHKREIFKLGASGYINNVARLFEVTRSLLKKPGSSKEGCAQQ